MTIMLPVVSVIISTVSISWAIFVTVRKGDVSRPALKFLLGFTGPAKRIGDWKITPKERSELSTVILVGKLEEGEMGVFPLHFSVQSSPKACVKNVQIILSYPQIFCIQDLSFIPHLEFANRRTIRLRPEANERTVSRVGSNAHVVYEHALFRPGEGIVSYEPILFRLSKKPTLDTQQNLENLPLEDRMRHSGVAGYFTVDVFLTAENCRPTTRRCNILWLNEDIGTQDAQAIAERIAHGFYGKFPKPGLYGKMPWEKPPFKWEEAEILQFDLIAAKHEERKFRIAEVDPVGLALAKISVPTWDYHEERRPVALDRYFSS